MQSPGTRAAADRQEWPRLEAYVRAVVKAFAEDERVLGWDISNEVTNFFLPHLNKPQPRRAFALAGTMLRRRLFANPTLDLMKAAFGWVRVLDPSQPLTAGSWYPEKWLNEQLYALSDVISFHHYKNAASLATEISELQRFNRPILCTEWLSRNEKSLPQTHLPIFRNHQIGSFNWGLVDGRTQTKYGWEDTGGTGEPQRWFHDLLHADGTVYDAAEATAYLNPARPN